PPVSVHQCQLSVLIHATCQCPLVPYHCLSVSPISASQCTYQCQSVLPISAANQCHLSVPDHPAYQCASVLPISSRQCCLSVPPNSASQCHLTVPVS
ncbi:unnamed protein product, partial [Staurois parvus]